MDEEIKLIVERSSERISAFILFVIFIGNAGFFLFFFITSLFKVGFLIINFLLSGLMIFIGIIAGVYLFKQTFLKRKLFEINALGINVGNDLWKWNSVLEVKVVTVPPPGLGFLYYLIGPKGVFFYQIQVYEDFFPVKVKKLTFSSQINHTWEEINEVISHYSIKKGFRMTW